MRCPFLTFVSEGKPLRRLLVISKKGSVFVLIMLCHIRSWVEGFELMLIGQEAGIRTRTVRFTGGDAAVTPQSWNGLDGLTCAACENRRAVVQRPRALSIETRV